MLYTPLLIILFLRSLAYPFLRLLGGFIPTLRERFAFEDKNNTEKGCESLHNIGVRADVCFHVSSEGEFELIRPLIDFSLSQGRRIEIIFSSPSVEKQILKLYSLYQDNISYLRLPILSFSLIPLLGPQNILKWVTAKKVMMVRYDFFPELLMLKYSLESFILFAASSKSKSNHDYRFYLKKHLYKLFDEIFPTTISDLEFFKTHFPEKIIHQEIDLRCLQIQKRQKHQELPNSVLNLLKLSNSSSNKIILAQMWPGDLAILDNKEFINEISKKKIFCYLAPHKLDEKFLNELTSAIKCDYYLISKNNWEKDIVYILENFDKSPRLIISQIPGLLCELYTHFNFCYVGGGFGKGVHSLLEPFVAGATIACGPNVLRSTEYDIACELGHEIKIYSQDNLPTFFSDLKQRDLNLVDVSSFIKQNESRMNKALCALGILND